MSDSPYLAGHRPGRVCGPVPVAAPSVIVPGGGRSARMRSIWKGAISFGLVTIPVKLYSATEQKDVAFHQVHREDGGRIKYRRVCTIDGEEFSYSDIAKGYERATGEMGVLADEGFPDLPLSPSRRIDVLQFSPVE